MKLATWNVNSIKVRLEAATAWLKEAVPVLLPPYCNRMARFGHRQVRELPQFGSPRIAETTGNRFVFAPAVRY